MKSQFFATVICLLLLISCRKSSAPAPPAPIVEYFTGKLNGTYFNESTIGRIIYAPNNTIQFTGFHAHGGFILTLQPFSGTTGDNIINNTNRVFIGNNGGLFYAGFVNGKVQGSGKITILEITSTFIRGSFECVAPSDSNYVILPTQVVTEGEFKLKRP